MSNPCCDGGSCLIQPPTEAVLSTACSLLSQGRLVAIPTETVYGLAANAFDTAAVEKIFVAKQRPATNPLIVHVASFERLSEAIEMPLSAAIKASLASLAEFWPGPLTLVLPRNRRISDLVTAGRDTVAVRIPSHPVARQLLDLCPFPLAAPSANRSKYISPTTAEHCQTGLADQVDLIIDGGACRFGVESTIVALEQNGARLLRPGGITAEQIAMKLGVDLHSLLPTVPQSEIVLEAPGMMREHYSPTTPLKLRCGNEGDVESRTSLRKARVAFRPLSDQEAARYRVVAVLSETGDFAEIANGLFAALRRLDRMDLDLIEVDSCAQEGLGRAIMDRLIRASAKS